MAGTPTSRVGGYFSILFYLYLPARRATGTQEEKDLIQTINTAEYAPDI